MSCRNYCSGQCGSGSLRNSCHIPVSPSLAICSANMSCGDVLCLPSSCQDRTWFSDNCQETCNDPASCQPADLSNYENSSCSSAAYYVPRPCQGAGFIPASSFVSSSCLPSSCRPLNYVFSHGRPLSPLINTYQPIGGVSSGCRPVTFLSNSCRPLNPITYGCRPSGCVVYGPQSPHVVSGSLRPLQPLSSCYQPLTHGFNICRPSCSAQGGQ